MLANIQVASFWDSHGTKIELSGPHAPWQNGTTERHAGLIKLLVRQFFEDTDDELGPQVGANFPLVLDLLTARKNEAPGGANVSDVSAYEAFFGRRPQSAFLRDQAAPERPAPLSYDAELLELKALHDRIDRLLLFSRTQALVRDALKKIAKPDRGPSPHGWRVWFFTSSSGKVKASGWKGPALC